MPVAITDAKHVCVGTFSEIRMKYESVLVLLARIARHVSNPRSEGVLCDHVVLDLLLLIAYRRQGLCRLGRRLRYRLFVWMRGGGLGRCRGFL